MAAELSHAVNLFLHKNRTSFFDDDSIASGALPPMKQLPALPEPPVSQCDLRASCAFMTSAFQYISRKLTERELSVALIISEHQPHVVPVWPLPRSSQKIFAQIIRKAVKKFGQQSSWLTQLASSSSKCMAEIFESYCPSSYIVRRSIIQNELIFSEEGLNLLCVDNIFTFKKLLCTLSRRDLVPHARDTCLSSCVHLLRRINEVYTDPKLSSGYMERVYQEMEFERDAYEEVVRANETNYCTASIKDFTSMEPDYGVLSEGNLDFEAEIGDEKKHDTKDLDHNQHELESIMPEPTLVAELPDTSSHSFKDDIISPLAPSDLQTRDSCEDHHCSDESLDIISPLTVRYPTIQQPRSSTAESPLDPHAPWNPPQPQPLQTRRASTAPTISLPSSYEVEKVPSAAELIEEWNANVRPSLKTIESASSGMSISPASPFEYVKSWVESWSTNAPSVLCENCHDVTVQPLNPRRFTMV